MIVLFLCATSSVVLAGGPPLQFGKMVGNWYGLAVASDSQSNIYVGSGPYTAALIKLDPSGNRLWSFPETNFASQSGTIIIRAIAIDPSDAVYVCGDLWGSVRAGAINYNVPGPATFFAKFTPTGSNLFAKIFYNMWCYTKPLARTTDGRFLVVGIFNNPVTYEGVTISPTSYSDALVFLINSDGSPVWFRRGTGNVEDYAVGVVATDTGEVAVTGASTSYAFGMAGLSVSVSAAKLLYLVKMDGTGSGLWAKSVGSSLNPDVSITISSAVTYSPGSDSIIWGGDFSGSLTLVSPPISSSGKDAFVAKLSSTGGVAWARTLGGGGDQFVNAAAVDRFGNIYVAGFFENQLTIGSNTLTSLGVNDLFVAKFTDEGTPLWVKQMGWTGNDTDVALAFTKADELLIAGTVRGGVSIDGAFFEGTNSYDGFIAKFHSEAVPPRFVTGPTNRAISAGMTFTLTAVLAINDPSVRFQWWFNGAPLAGQTNLTLTVTNAQSTHAGSYYLVAMNDGGATRSASALISYTDASTLLLSIHPSLTIFGTPGRTYRIEHATESATAAQWTTATNLTLDSSPQVWVDPTAALGEKRFYRVLLLP